MVTFNSKRVSREAVNSASKELMLDLSRIAAKHSACQCGACRSVIATAAMRQVMSGMLVAKGVSRHQCDNAEQEALAAWVISEIEGVVRGIEAKEYL